MIQAAINGKRSKHEHPKVPVTALELLHSAKSVLKAGADTIHFHVRDGKGQETLDPAMVAPQVGQLKAALPGVSIGISTGAWIQPDLEKRVAQIREWETIPDYVSVNGHEPGFPQIIDVVRQKGMSIEAGIRDQASAKRLVADGFLKYCFRVLIEPPEQDLNSALQTVTAIENVLAGHVLKDDVVLHGVDATCWPVLKTAISRGYNLRMGLEDTLLADNGNAASDNASLVRYVAQLAGIKV